VERRVVGWWGTKKERRGGGEGGEWARKGVSGEGVGKRLQNGSVKV